MPTLLVVDDDEQTVLMVQELMEVKGFEVLPATSPEEARRVAETHPGTIDLLITDVVMPGTSGYVLSEQVKRCRPEIRVLFMSGFVVVPAHYGLSGEDRGLEPGAAILAKPFTGSRLHEKVREVLGAPAAVRTPPREPALSAWPSKRPSRRA
jgi:DNA-binding response OmpR family regulator